MKNEDLHIPISKTPILLSFLQRIIEFGGQFSVEVDLENELFIEYCEDFDGPGHNIAFTCNKPWNQNLLDKHEYLIDTAKGFSVIRFYKNRKMSLLIWGYQKFPHKAEIKRLLKGCFSTPSKKELLLLEDYFKDLEGNSIIYVTVNA